MNLIANPAPAGAMSPAATVRRIAFYLPSRGATLFAWLHCPEEGRRLDHGVVLCPPAGYEQIHSHRSLRHLADALARAGFFALRFDYHGTGDSPGTDDDPDRLATWRANVRDARDWLQHELGCGQVSVVGVRLGAALAALAAAEQPVDQLVLWAPVVKGNAYVRELKALGLAARGDDARPAQTSDGLEAGGFALTPQTVAELRQLDLLRCRPQCHRLLVVSRDDLNLEGGLLAHLEKAGIAADHVEMPGYAGMMAEPHDNQVPRQAIAAITEWLLAGAHGERSPEHGLEALHALPAETRVVGGSHCVRERVLHLRERPNLFGIVTEPEGGAPAALPTVVLVNAGSAYRVAPSRLYVLLARALAARGFRSVRLDIGGLGDSGSTHPEFENHPYPPSMFPDIEFALRQIQAREGAERIVLLGLCSGAYAAFQSAVHLTCPALEESVLINPLAFYWKTGMTLDTSPVVHLTRVDHLHRAALNPKKWLDLLTGRTTLGFRGVARLVLQHLRMKYGPDARPAQPAGAEQPEFENGHPAREDLPGDLERVARGGRRLAFFLGTRDPSYRILMFHARRKAKQLLRAGAASLFFVQDADHTFTERGPRESLVRQVCDYLAGRYVQ